MDKVEITDSCWLWVGCKHGKGYGNFHMNKKVTLAHRASYMLFVGNLDPSTVVHHKCHNRRCVNPEHLQTVSHHENTAEMLDRVHLLKCIAKLEKDVRDLQKKLRKANGR